MPRKKNKVNRAEVRPDPKFNSLLVQKLVNRMMLDGKKLKSYKIVYGAMSYLSNAVKDDPLSALEKSIANIKPPVEVRSRRVGGATYQVPVDIRPERQMSLSMRWLVNLSRKRREHSMIEKLGKELVDAYNNAGSCIKKKQDTVRMAEANKAFAHYKW